MQTNNSFYVGGSISVNCHGWQPNVPPIAHTVKSFRLVTAKGDILECSRRRNKELFSLVMGGYGLFGVVIDAKFQVVPNEMYITKQYVVKSNNYVNEFRRFSSNSNVAMAYGRINVHSDHFLEEAIISTFEKDGSYLGESLESGPYKGL